MRFYGTVFNRISLEVVQLGTRADGEQFVEILIPEVRGRFKINLGKGVVLNIPTSFGTDDEMRDYFNEHIEAEVTNPKEEVSRIILPDTDKGGPGNGR